MRDAFVAKSMGIAGPPVIRGLLLSSVLGTSFGILLPMLGTLSLRKASTLFPDLLTCCFLLRIMAPHRMVEYLETASSGAKARPKARKMTYLQHTLNSHA